MIARAILFLLWAGIALPGCAGAQGFAGLGTSADGFALPSRQTQFNFPEDHGAHPDFRIEWWYLTANLESEDGRQFGLQWTLFRSALKPENPEGWSSPQIWMAHAAVTSETDHWTAETFARGGIGQAGVVSAPFSAWINDWSLTGPTGDLDQLRVTAKGAEFSYVIDLAATGPLVRHGDDGYSVKSPDGQASYYYSQPKFAAEGQLVIGDAPIKVRGQAWFDREWSSQPLSADQSGWDWFSLSFEDGQQLMGFVLRSERGDFTSGTWISATGQATALPPRAFVATPRRHSTVAGRRIPTTWRIQVPAHNVDVEVAALNRQSWMDLSFSYWEGPVTVRGSHRGVGYLEMTGYGQ